MNDANEIKSLSYIDDTYDIIDDFKNKTMTSEILINNKQ